MEGSRSDLRTAAVDAEAAHAASDAAVTLPERWRLVELLGSGGQATVWLAEDRMLGQRVALKILRAGADERTRARWLEEVRQGRRLSHPNLIRIHDVVEASDRPVAVMELVPGGTLAERVLEHGAQPVDDVVRWAREVLEVLGYLHEQRIVHRDVKPSNLLVAEDGRVKLSDLGLVRSLDRDSDLTATMEGVGTPRFMAPEQLRGEPPSPACDLYSLGVTMYQLLTGRLPFDGDSAFQIADGHLHAEPAPVREHRPECPRWLAAFVHRLLEKDPRARFASAAAAALALEGRRVGLSRRAWRRVAVALVLTAAAVIGAALVLTGARGDLDRVEVQGDSVIARTADNRRLWTADRPLERPVTAVEDFVGDPHPEVAIGWSQEVGGTDPNHGVHFELRSERGEVLRTFDSAAIPTTFFPEVAPIYYIREMTTANTLGEGADLVWGLGNARWYSAVIGVTSFRSSTEEPVVLFANSGHSQCLSAADLDGDGTDEIVAVVFNNPMGFQRVLVTFGARSRFTGEPCLSLASPDILAFSQARTSAPNGCSSYTLLGSGVRVVESPRVSDAGIELRVNDEVRRFDLWGNPEGAPTFGAGGRARESFWNDLALTSAKLRLAARVDPPFTMARLRADHPEIFAERPSEVAAYLVAARALASGGHRENAISVLREAVDRHPDENDLRLRLGEQLLIAGERTEGRRWVAGSIAVGSSSGRAHTDLIFMLILDAAVHGDRPAYDETRLYAGNLTSSATNEVTGYLDIAWLFYQGQWSDPRLVDADPHWVHLWLRVVQAWARFEATGLPGPALEVAAELATLPETRDFARILEARVRLAAGDATAASELAQASLDNITTQCRVSYEACVWAPLAEWVAGRALVEQGQVEEGTELLRRAADRAPGTWIAAVAPGSS
jgi:hypothetical protein